MNPKSGAPQASRACFGHQDHPTAGRAIEHRPRRLEPTIRKAYALAPEKTAIEAKVEKEKGNPQQQSPNPILKYPQAEKLRGPNFAITSEATRKSDYEYNNSSKYYLPRQLLNHSSTETDIF